MFTKTANKQKFQRVVIKPEFRGNGLSKKYFYETEKYLKEQTGRPVNLMLTTTLFNRVAFKLYKKQGFKVVKAFNAVIFFGLFNLLWFLMIKYQIVNNNA